MARAGLITAYAHIRARAHLPMDTIGASRGVYPSFSFHALGQ